MSVLKMLIEGATSNRVMKVSELNDLNEIIKQKGCFMNIQPTETISGT
jgi:hypothetical protein